MSAIKSGMQMMLEQVLGQMLGPDVVKQLEDFKQKAPQIAERLSAWMKKIDTQLDFIVGMQQIMLQKFENLEFMVDDTKVEDAPPTLLAMLEASVAATDPANIHGAKETHINGHDTSRSN